MVGDKLERVRMGLSSRLRILWTRSQV